MSTSNSSERDQALIAAAILAGAGILKGTIKGDGLNELKRIYDSLIDRLGQAY